MGAGCSVSAGVPTAGEIVRQASRHIFRAYESREPIDDDEVSAWLRAENLLQDPIRAYGEALQLLRPTPRLRRMFLERFFVGKEPSPAHWALAKLVQSGVFRHIYTTNFDDLVERATSQLTKLRVVSYDQQAADTALSSSVATLFKLHGDYLFDNIANTEHECKHLGQSQSEKLRSALTEGGIIVAGYSGRDSSVMRVMMEGASARIPLGVYWLQRRGDALTTNVKELLETVPGSYLCWTSGFDEFAARLFSQMSRRTSPRNVQRRSRTEIFVSHSDGVGKIISNIDKELREVDSRIIAVTGLPGVGKTATVFEVAERALSDFSATMFVDSKDRQLGVAEFLDECRLQLPVSDDASSSADDAVNRLIDFLSATRTLIVIDNLDAPLSELMDLLDKIPTPSKVLLTTRDIVSVRTRIPLVAEVRHAGLSDGEMQDLLSALARRNPSIGERLDRANPVDVQHVIEATHGWPQALILLLRRMSTSLMHFDEAASILEQKDTYASLLDDAFKALTKAQRSILRTIAAFPRRCTVEGVVAVSLESANRVTKEMASLISTGWLTETSSGQYGWAHPIVGAFVRSQELRRASSNSTRRERVRSYLNIFAEENGGQPNAKWSNFRELDREFQNLRALMDELRLIRDLKSLTSLYRSLFSYVVERGLWIYAELTCEEVVHLNPGKDYMIDWMIWWSWIKLYLRDDYLQSAELAERAIAMHPRFNRQKFEAHRRALVAHAALGNDASVEHHYQSANEIRIRTWSDDSDEAIDLMNAFGDALIRRFERQGATRSVQDALLIFENVQQISARRANPNTREVGVAMLGQARGLHLAGQSEDALVLARRVVEQSIKISWLRGVAESNSLVASIAEGMGEHALADSAAKLSRAMKVRLRNVSTGVS